MHALFRWSELFVFRCKYLRIGLVVLFFKLLFVCHDECKPVHKPCMLEFVYGKCLRFDTLPLICTKTGVTK